MDAYTVHPSSKTHTYSLHNVPRHSATITAGLPLGHGRCKEGLVFKKPSGRVDHVKSLAASRLSPQNAVAVVLATLVAVNSWPPRSRPSHWRHVSVAFSTQRLAVSVKEGGRPFWSYHCSVI